MARSSARAEAGVALLGALALLLAACSSGTDRTFARYYDPHGLFTANLPAANDITVAQPQPSSNGPGILSGVIASPPLPSPTPQSALGGGLNLSQTGSTDQTIYEAFAVTTDSFSSLSDMTLYFLTGDPSIDVQSEQAVRLGGTPGRLVVANVVHSGTPSAAVALALTLGEAGTGYLVAAIFPPETWDHERADFLSILGSFRTGVPPGIATFPVTSGAT